MKKSLIWLLAAIMALTFGVLLYFQLIYMQNMVTMRENQFSEGVMRSLHSTAEFLERQEALYYLVDDINMINYTTSITSLGGFKDLPSTSFQDEEVVKHPAESMQKIRPLRDQFKELQNTIHSQYLFQKELLDELILTILSDAGNRAVMERADSTYIREYLSAELNSNGINLPFTFAVTDMHNRVIYSTKGFNIAQTDDIYSDILFQNSNIRYKILVQFPTKNSFIHSSVKFIIPTLAFTVILLFVFVYTIVLILRQKKISEMKSDFVSNMTHELKTPISSISLAGQMLSDSSVSKSPAMLKNLSNVITEESKRLRFQVDKVLQLSVFDNTDTEAALKFTEINANDVISNVVNNFKLRVEKHGGEIRCNLNAENATIYVDEMQFNNVINNLLENALKYRHEKRDPILTVSTRDISKHRLEIKVRDNGIGIKKDEQKKIFDKFYRVSTGNRHDVKGFGLGLVYVKKMLSFFKGEVTVESEFGKWTEFTLLIPLSEASYNHEEDKTSKTI